MKRIFSPLELSTHKSIKKFKKKSYGGGKLVKQKNFFFKGLLIVGILPKGRRQVKKITFILKEYLEKCPNVFLNVTWERSLKLKILRSPETLIQQVLLQYK